MKAFYTPSYEELDKELDKEVELVKKGKQKYVKIYNGGSFTSSEIPQEIKNYLLEGLKKRNCKKLRIENRFDIICWEEIETLLHEGFDITISWGFETADDALRDFIQKGISKELAEKILRISTQLGVKNLIYLMAGLPTANYVQDCYGSIDWVVKNKNYIHEVVMLPYVPMKGSSFYETHWKTNLHRVISKEEWKKCRDYALKKLQAHFPGERGIDVSFATMSWRYICGKTYEEAYKKRV